jgi:N6-L-threonylcarbamoyladenine synthase
MIKILAIESSCDETSAAIIGDGHEVISLTIATQMDIHAEFGGVVPEIASRMHAECIDYVIDDCLKKAKMQLADIDAVAVTYAPGLLGSLLVGIEAAKAISYATNKPLIAVNHLAGHIYANNLESKLTFPLLALIVSGGHTELVLMHADYDFEILGSTLDDAIGEAYDKVARVLDLKYPGGPNVEKLALEGKPTYQLPIPMNDNTLNMSFSGLKSSIINLVHNETQRGKTINKADLACSFQTVAVAEIVNKVKLALAKTKVKNMIIAGGVSANSYLRAEIQKVCQEKGINLSVPRLLYCTDNAAMIGAAAYPLYLKKQFANYDLNGKSQIDLIN